jgi:hypothetical protein
MAAPLPLSGPGYGMSFAKQAELDQTSSSERALQAAALAEIQGVLLSAGYFRARIQGLSAFDKVHAL